MGTEITLSVGGIHVDYAKNWEGNNYGALFHELNRRPVHCSHIDYDIFHSENRNVTAYEMAFVRPLFEIVPRLEMMGYALDHVSVEYSQACKHYLDDIAEVTPGTDLPQLLSFDEFRQFVVE